MYVYIQALAVVLQANEEEEEVSWDAAEASSSAVPPSGQGEEGGWCSPEVQVATAASDEADAQGEGDGDGSWARGDGSWARGEGGPGSTVLLAAMEAKGQGEIVLQLLLLQLLVGAVLLQLLWEPPKLDDQECTFPPKDQGVLAVDGETYTDGRDPLAPWDPSGIDLDEELAKLRQRSSEPIYVPDEEKPPAREGPGSLTDKPDSDSKPKHSITSHDPHTMPDGEPVPEGYNWDGIRLVRNKKGSKRPPDTSSEEWHNMSRGQREADIERYQARLKRESAARAEEEKDAAPAMPTKQCVDEPHRVKTATLYWEKLGEISELQYALVARVVNQAEIDRTPAAKQAMDKEWQKLVDKSCWLHSKFLEDNQATITIVNKGDSEKMRHTDRTQNISFGWLKQEFEAEHFDMVNVDTLEQVADIFTKPFAEKTK
eukprot:s9334_g1.t1